MKVVCVGNAFVGKTSLLYTFVNRKYPSDYVPTIFDNYRSICNYSKLTFSLIIFDVSSGDEEFPGLRLLCYPMTDVCLFCFSLSVLNSLLAIKSLWFNEVANNVSDTCCFVLVGTKLDLLSDAKEVSKSNNKKK